MKVEEGDVLFALVRTETDVSEAIIFEVKRVSHINTRTLFEVLEGSCVKVFSHYGVKGCWRYQRVSHWDSLLVPEGKTHSVPKGMMEGYLKLHLV